MNDATRTLYGVPESESTDMAKASGLAPRLEGSGVDDSYRQLVDCEEIGITIHRPLHKRRMVIGSVGALRIAELGDRYIWQFAGGLHGYQPTVQEALIDALESLGYEVELKHLTTDATLEFALAASIAAIKGGG